MLRLLCGQGDAILFRPIYADRLYRVRTICLLCHICQVAAMRYLVVNEPIVLEYTSARSFESRIEEYTFLECLFMRFKGSLEN